MVENRLTTEFYEDTLSIVIVDTVECFASYFVKSCASKNIETTILSSFDIPAIEAQSILGKAYKVVVCVSPAFHTPQVTQLLEYLQSFQEKVYVVMPVVSGCQEQMYGEIPYLSRYFKSQNELIGVCNEVLPQSTFIFGQDVLLPPGKISLFELCCQNIQKGFIFVPSIHVTPHLLADFCEQAVLELLRPHRMSVSIKGRTRFAQSVLEKISRQYEGYFFCQVGMQRVTAAELETVPFTVKDVSITSDEESTALWFSRQLPSPEMDPFFPPPQLAFYQSITSEPSTSGQEHNEQFEALPKLPFDEPIQPDIWAEPAREEPELNPDLQPIFPIYSQIITLEKTLSQADQNLAESALLNARANSGLGTAESFKISEKKIDESSIIDEFNVSSEIQRIFMNSRVEKKTERVVNLSAAHKNLVKKSKKKTTLFYGGLGFVALGASVLLLIVIFMSSAAILKNQVLMILSTPVSEVTSGQLQRTKFVSNFLSFQSNTYSKAFKFPQVEEAEKLVEVVDHLALLHSPDSESAQNLKKLFLLVMGSSTGDIAQLTENITTETVTTYEAASVVEQALQEISFSDETTSETVLAEYQKKLERFKKQTAIIQQLGPQIPAIFGNEKKRSYAFILQNNQELRPTGGFMDAVAILTFEKGMMVDHQLYTGYELDKKMLGEVDAPSEITKATGEKQFAFYDANWSPDFPTSATTIEWFLGKILNKNIDGVMTIDLFGVQKLLEVTGPLDLPEYNEVITHKNLLERLEFHSEVVLLETEKNHDYRKVLFSHLLDRIILLPEDKIPALLTALHTTAGDKSVLLSFADPQEAQMVQNLGWSGSQLVPHCPGEFSSTECFMDHLMQVEANVGINKANYYLKRAIDHSIEVSSTQAVHAHTISYENTAQLDAWPKGPYKNYLRVYLPSSAQKVSITVEGQQLPESQITRTTEKDFLVVGSIIEVPIKSQRQVTVSYAVPLSPTTPRFSYVFFNNEQPGNGVTPFRLRIVSAPGLHPQVVAPQATVDTNGIVFSRNNDETSLFAVEFTQAK